MERERKNTQTHEIHNKLDMKRSEELENLAKNLLNHHAHVDKSEQFDRPSQNWLEHSSRALSTSISPSRMARTFLLSHPKKSLLKYLHDFCTRHYTLCHGNKALVPNSRIILLHMRTRGKKINTL